LPRVDSGVGPRRPYPLVVLNEKHLVTGKKRCPHSLFEDRSQFIVNRNSFTKALLGVFGFQVDHPLREIYLLVREGKLAFRSLRFLNQDISSSANLIGGGRRSRSAQNEKKSLPGINPIFWTVNPARPLSVLVDRLGNRDLAD
jgi:hypothetical protein